MAKKAENRYLQDKNGDLFLNCKQLSDRKGLRKVTESQLAAADDDFEVVEDAPPKAAATKAEKAAAKATVSEEGWE